MIYFTVNGQKLGIQFSYAKENGYFNDKEGRWRPYQYRTDTFCEILELGSTSKDEMTQRGYGRALLHWDDNFVAETGRKIALGRALENLSREIRSAAWQAYFNRKNCSSRNVIESREILTPEESC